MNKKTQAFVTLLDQTGSLEAERDALKTQNAALVAALEEALPIVESVYLDAYDESRNGEDTEAYFQQLERHKAALAAAKEGRP